MKNFGDITKINGAEVPIVDIITGGSPCFAAGTLITTDHGLVPIEDIKVGDSVLTHNNRFMPVTDTGYTGDKFTYNLYGMSCEKIIATGNHPFYARKVSRVWDNNSHSYRKEFSAPSWIPLQNLSEEYYLGSPINNLSVDALDITDEEAYLLGRYVADGYVRNSQRKDRKPGSLHYVVIYCIGAAKLENFLSKITTYNYSSNYNRTAYKVRICSKKLTQLCLLCGKGAAGKYIPPEILNLPKDKLQWFFDGYMDGDGCYSKNMYSITTVSRLLAYGVIQIVTKLYNSPCSLYFVARPKTTTIEGRTVNQHDTYQVKFSKIRRKQEHAFCEDGYVWFPIRRIEENTTIPVYNLSVQTDESYCANGAIVHNCQDLSVAGKRAGLAGERSGLFMEQIRIVKEMRDECRKTNQPIRPRFLVWENVAGAYSSGNPGGSDFQAVLEEICKVVRHDCPIVPIPKDGWPLAGNLDGVGDDGTPFSICWRTHDAQYWGVPQRRRRIALVADFGGTSAPEILFESNSLPGNTQESGETRERTSGDPTNSTGSASQSARESVTAFGISSYDSNAMKSDNPNSGIYEADSARTLDLNGGNPACNQGGIAIVQNSEPIAYRGDSITSPVNASNPEPGDPCHTLTADDRNYVVQSDAIGCDIYNSAVTGDVAASLTAQGSLSAGGSGPSVIVNTPDGCLNPWDVQSKHIQSEDGVAEALYAAECRYGGGESYVLQKEPVLLESNQNHATIQTDGISTTLPASMGEGGGYVPMVAIEGNGARGSHKGDGYAETETMYTLNTVEQHAVAYAVESHAQDARYNVGDTNQTLGANMEHDPANGGLVLCSDVHGFQGQVGATVPLPIDKELSPTMVRNQIPDVVYATQACGDRDNSGQSFSEEVAYTIPVNPMSDRGQAVVQSVQSMELFHCTSEEELAAPLKARDYKDPQVVAFEPGAASRVGGHVYTDGKAGTLRAEMGDNQQAVCQNTVYSIDQGAGKSACNFDVNRAPTLTTTHGGEPVVLNDQGGDNAPLVFGRQHDVTSDNITPSLCAKMGTGGNNVPCVLNPDPQSTEDSSVVFENHSQDTRYNELGEVCQTVSATWGMGGNNQPLEVKPQQAIVRRLTPLECERLQGFPDYWVHIGDWVDSKGKKHKDSDSPKYKALGNSIALPFWYWMAGRMVAQLKKSGVEHPTMASLFDGIAGFPYVYIRHGCMPLWTSEIEEFPMAVCRKHFGDEETGEVGDIGEYLKLPPNWKSAATSGERVTDSTVAFDRATFNQGANAKYDFSVEQGVAQTLLSRGPGGSANDLNADVIGSLCATDYKGIRNQDIDDGKAILQPNE